TLARGGRATLPRIAQPTLAAAFIDPALDWLTERHTRLVTGRRLRALEFSEDRVSGLVWSDGPEAVAEDQAVVLALPTWVATTMVPNLTGPDIYRAIVNGH